MTSSFTRWLAAPRYRPDSGTGRQLLSSTPRRSMHIYVDYWEPAIYQGISGYPGVPVSTVAPPASLDYA